MNEERRQVLNMLAEGKISAEEAERLLDKIGSAESAPNLLSPPGSTERPAKPKYLRVHVDSAEGDKVNVRVPLALIRTGIKLTTVLPEHATEKLVEKGIDLGRLSGLDSEALNQALRELQVDVDSSEGDVVRVFCE
jgi:hypothetical protein